MNELAPLNTKQTEYLKRCQASWFNIAEGGKRRRQECIELTCFLHST
jgi:hypothetical protein